VAGSPATKVSAWGLTWNSLVRDHLKTGGAASKPPLSRRYFSAYGAGSETLQTEPNLFTEFHIVWATTCPSYAFASTV
jgi:hypothetical protein